MSLAERLGPRERPVVVQFHAPWCGPCKALSPRVDAMEKEFEGKVDVVRIDIDQEPDLAREAGVRGVPTLAVFRDGAEVRRHVGSLDPSGLRVLFASGSDPLQAAAPVGRPAWHLAARFGGGVALVLAASAFPAADWLRWPGYGLLFWAMTEMCPSCRAPGQR